RAAGGVAARAERELAQEASALALAAQPLDAIVAARCALGADGEQLAIDVHVDGLGVKAREVGVEQRAVAVAEKVDRHPTGADPACDAVELTEWIEEGGRHVRSFLKLES